MDSITPFKEDSISNLNSQSDHPNTTCVINND